MTETGVDIIVILIVAGGLMIGLILYVEWKLTKIARDLKDIAEALQRLGKSPGKKKDKP